MGNSGHITISAVFLRCQFQFQIQWLVKDLWCVCVFVCVRVCGWALSMRMHAHVVCDICSVRDYLEMLLAFAQQATEMLLT